MTNNKRKSGLGRGLATLIGNNNADNPREQITTPAPAATAPITMGEKKLPIEFLSAGKYQPRQNFDKQELAALADSFRKNGILQPLLVRPLKGVETTDKYEIIAGERRWRAAQLARLAEVPVIIREFSDTQALEAGLIENIQRTELNPLEEAEGYKRLAQEFHYTQNDIAEIIGKSRPHIANALRLLSAPPLVQTLLHEGKLSAGHARAILGHKDCEALAKTIVAGGLSVRAAENLAKADTPNNKKTKVKKIKSADIVALEKRLRDATGLTAAIETKSRESGKLILDYKTLEQLDSLIKKIII